MTEEEVILETVIDLPKFTEQVSKELYFTPGLMSNTLIPIHSYVTAKVILLQNGWDSKSASDEYSLVN